MKRRAKPGGFEPSLEALIERLGDVENATLVDAPPSQGYSYELKYDGYRILAFKLGDDVRLISRRGQDWTDEFAQAAQAVQRQLPGRDLVLDGEVVALDERGVPSFQRLQHRLPPLAYVLFDVLWLDGRDLRGEPLEQRRALLDGLLPNAEAPLARSTAVQGDARELLELACRSGFEGLIGKRLGSAYRPGRGLDWIKLKCQLRQEFAIIGYLPFTGTQRGVVGSLLLALRAGDECVFAGKVGTGFDQATRAALGELLEARRVASSPAVGVPKFGGLVRFVELGPVAEVSFTEWTEGGHARHPSYMGLRPDKRPEDCVREGSASAVQAPPVAATSSREKRVSVLGIGLSHPERVLTPMPLSKLELARYYEAVGEWMLPQVQGRPLTLVRWAEGKHTEKGGVYLRHRRAWGPSALGRVHIREQRKIGEYLVVEDAAGLVALAQMDILECHTWNSTRDDVERPNRIVFDLDPGPEVGWPSVVRAAKRLRALLQSVGLESWLKTTGGKGLHLVVPLVPEHDWPTCHAASRTIAEQFAASDPSAYTTNVQRGERSRKILIDYLRNSRGNTSVAAYSPRANAAASVSTPIHWDELSTRLQNARFTVATLPRRLKALAADPWRDYFCAQQHLFKREP